MDPLITVARPLAAFFTAAVAGISENLLGRKKEINRITPDLSCPVDGCCSGDDCDPEIHSRHHSFFEKIKAGIGERKKRARHRGTEKGRPRRVGREDS